MGSLDRLEIYLENSIDGRFNTGDVVHGKLIVVLRASMKIHGIEMKIRGRGHAEWKETSGLEECQLYETLEYLKESVIVLGKEAEAEGPPHIEFMDSGQHEFPFQFSLPSEIPSSFEGMHGYIRYWVKAKIYGVWGLLDQSGKVEFGVVRPLDLNKIPGAMDSAEDEDSCVMCGCCLNMGALTASVKINRRGFIPGEVIICNAEIWNGSETTIKSSRLQLYQIVTYGDIPFASNTREKQTIHEIVRGRIKPGRDYTYIDEKFEIPTSLPATSLPGCSFIDVDYVVELKVCASQEDFSLRIPLLIIVGTKPLSELEITDDLSTTNSAPIRDNVANDSSAPLPVLVQPNPLVLMTSYQDELAHASLLPTASAPPMATELHNLHGDVHGTVTPFSPPPSRMYPISNEIAEGNKTDTNAEPVPTMEIFSVLEREQTLNEMYYGRKRSFRKQGIVNHGAAFDDEEDGL